MYLTVTAIPPDVEIQRQLTTLHIDTWVREDFLHFRWWCLLVLLVVIAYAWWKIIDKSMLPEIILYAALAAVVVMAINEYGEELTLWDYPTDILPIFPPLTSINLASLPLIYSLAHQFFKSRKSFILATLVITGILCFVIEPLLAWGGFYQLLKWKYYFSYPIYWATAIFIRIAVHKINAIFEKNRIKNIQGR